MPLQWLRLQERKAQQQQRSPVSEALTPRQGVGAMPAGESFMERSQRLREVDAARKFQEKMMKMQHEQGMEKAKFAAGLQEDARKGAAQMTAGQALGRQAPAGTTALTKENMPEAAKTMWEFILTLDEAGQKFFINQLKQKEQPTGGYIEAGGVRKEMPGSVGMYGHLVDQGLIDPATDTIIEKEPETMKGRFSIEEGYIYDTTTSERKKLSIDEPEKAVEEINSEANTFALGIAKTGEVAFEDAKYDYLIDNKVDPDIAKDISKVELRPKTGDERSAWNKFTDWIESQKKKLTPELETKLKRRGIPVAGAGVPGAVAFNEANVSSLVPVISDDVTAAERAHLKGQGASDADIDEAIRRKGR